MFRSKKFKSPLFRLYGLFCPLEKRIKYVGVTINPEYRLSHHLGATTENIQKREWVEKLKNMNLSPSMIIISTFTDRNKAIEAELNYIEENGIHLFNSPIKIKYADTPKSSALENLMEITFTMSKDSLSKLIEISKIDGRSKEREISYLIKQRFEELVTEKKVFHSNPEIKQKTS